MIKHKERLNKKKVKLINVMSFLFGFSYAVSAYVVSLYFQRASGFDNVGIFYLISFIAVLILLLNFHKIVKKYGKSFTLFLFLSIKMLSAGALIFLPVSSIGVLLVMLYIVSGILSLTGIDIILESFSSDKMSGRIRGLYLTILNAGFILGPFLSMKVLDNFDFIGVFLLIFVFDFIVFLLAMSQLKKVNHEFNRGLTIFKLLSRVWKRPNIMRIYYISFALDFFYATVIVYSFLYLRSIGIPLHDIGIIFTIMLLPFVLFQYPAGVLADKKTGEKEFLFFALFVMGVSTIAIYFVESTSILVWGAILFATRIGASLIEILRDSYFYKRIDGHDVDIIDFFRTTRPIAYILFTIVSSIMLLYLPMKTVFILAGAVALFGLYPTARLVDNKCEEEMKNYK